jgi:hypothetical protein
MSSLYEQNLWNKIDFLHERYTRHHTYMSHFLDIMSRYHQACFDFSKSIKNIISKNYSLSDDESSTWNNSMKSFINCLSSHSQLFLQTSENIKNTIIDPITKSLQEHSLKEKDTYMTYNKTRNIYNNLKNSLDKAHKEFELKAKDSENLVYNSKKAKLQNLGNPEQLAKMEAKATDALTSATMCEEKYMNIIDDANKARENETLLQKKTHNFYETCDNYYYTQIKSVIGFNITNLKQMASSIKMEIIDLTDRFDRLSLENDIKEFIEKNKSDAKPDSNIEFIPYVPCPELSKRSSSKSLNKQEIADFDIKCEVVSTFKKYFKNIRADLNMVEEKNKNTMRNLIDRLLKVESNPLSALGKKELEDLLNQLRDLDMKSYFLLYLSKVKSKGLIESEKLFMDLKEIIFYILKLSEEAQDFETTQNCIILSQKLYMENKITKTKKYLVDYIRDYNWLNTIEFWESIIELMIQKEITKNEEINKNKDEKEQQSNAKNIVFSQVFSYSGNMVEFNIKKEDIIEMVEKFCREFEIDKSMLDVIVENVNNMMNNKIQRQKEEEEKNKKMMEEMKKDEKNGQPQKVEVIKDYFSADK